MFSERGPSPDQMGINPAETRTSEENEQLAELNRWRESFHAGGNESALNQTEERLKAFVNHDGIHKIGGLQGHDLLFAVDRGMEEALASGDRAATERMQSMLQQFQEEGGKEIPDLDRLADVVTVFIQNRLPEMKSNIDARINHTDVSTEDRGSFKEKVQDRIDRALAEIKRKQTERNPNNSKPFTKQEVYMEALRQAEEVRHAGGAGPEFDPFSYRVKF